MLHILARSSPGPRWNLRPRALGLARRRAFLEVQRRGLAGSSPPGPGDASHSQGSTGSTSGPVGTVRPRAPDLAGRPTCSRKFGVATRTSASAPIHSRRFNTATHRRASPPDSGACGGRSARVGTVLRWLRTPLRRASSLALHVFGALRRLVAFVPDGVPRRASSPISGAKPSPSPWARFSSTIFLATPTWVSAPRNVRRVLSVWQGSTPNRRRRSSLSPARAGWGPFNVGLCFLVSWIFQLGSRGGKGPEVAVLSSSCGASHGWLGPVWMVWLFGPEREH